MRVVSLPGHTPGHVGVVVTDGAMSIMMVGDATFDLDQSARGGVSGVSTNVGDARTTQRALTALTKNGVVVLPAHDPTVFQRMAAAR